MAMTWTTDGMTYLTLHHAGWGLIDARYYIVRAYVGQMKYETDSMEMPKLGKWHAGTLCNTVDDAKAWIEERIGRHAQANVAEVGTTGGG